MNKEHINIPVYINGELDTRYGQPTGPTAALEAIKSNVVCDLLGKAALQGRMFVYDTVHNTNYRTIRNELVREQRNKAFEKQLGLVAVSRK